MSHPLETAAPDRDAHDAAGFTLVEMLVVLVVLALTAGLSGPVLGRIGAVRVFDRFEDELRGRITLARAAAIRSGGVVTLVLDAPRRTFRNDAGLAPLALPVGVAAAIETSVARGRAADGLILFLPDGRSSGGTIRLERAGDVRRLTVERLTGAVRRAREGRAREGRAHGGRAHGGRAHGGEA